MTARLASISYRAPRAVLVGCLALAVGLGAYAISVPDRLALGGGETGGSESEQARSLLTAELGYDPEAAFVVVLSSAESISAPSSAVAVDTLVAQIESVDGVVAVERDQPSDDGLSITVSAFVSPDHGPEQLRSLESTLRDDLDPGPLDLRVGGSIATDLAVRDVAGAEAPKLTLLALPLLLLLLAATLGWRVAPAALLGAVLASAASVAALGVVAESAEINVLAVVPAAFGAAVLAVEFGTGLLYRYREEAATVGPGSAAMEDSLRTILRAATIGMFSAALVGAGLLLIPIDIVRSLGAGTVAAALLGPLLGVVPVAAAIALGAASESGEALPLISEDDSAEDAPLGFRLLLSIARGRSRGAIALVPIAAVAALALPLLDSEAVGLQDTDLPTDEPAAEAGERIAAALGPGAAGPLFVVTDGPAEAPAVAIYRDRIASIGSVRSVRRRPSGEERSAFEAVPDSRPRSLAALQTLADVRAEPAPSGRHVGGPAAELADASERLGDDLPLVGLLALLGTAALWSLLFRSAFAPLLALASAIAPLAGIGAMSAVFGEGNLTGLLDYTPAGAPHLHAFVVVGSLLLAIGLARGAAFATALREERLLGGGAAGSIARSGLLTLMPAAIATLLGAALAGVWLGSELLPAKELAVGLGAGLLADLILTRAILAPALARLSI